MKILTVRSRKYLRGGAEYTGAELAQKQDAIVLFLFNTDQTDGFPVQPVLRLVPYQ